MTAMMTRVVGVLVVALLLATAGPALADRDDDHERWEHRHGRHGWHREHRRYRVEPESEYYYAPRYVEPEVYYAPPVYVPPPPPPAGLSLVFPFYIH